MNEIQKYDVCIIGAGPGGYVAAIQAGRTGAKTLLIEKDFPGGTCLNWGCIPTKTLIASAETLSLAKNAAEFGVNITGLITPDWQKIQQRKNDIVQKLRTGINGLLKNAGVEVLTGTAKFNSNTALSVSLNKAEESIIVESKKIIIATGSRPAIPEFIPKSPRILDSTAILDIKEIPKSLIILGGGVIGCEFASLFAELGSDVTIVEMTPELLPEQDIEISKQIAREFKKRKIQVFTGKPIKSINTSNDFISGLVGGQEIKAQYMLVSTGRLPVIESLELQNAGIHLNEKKFIPVNSRCETNVSNIYAIGDVTGRVHLAHMASTMGVCAAKNATGETVEFSDKLVPGCIFTSPEIGSIGSTQQYCERNNISVKIGKFPFSALGKAIAINQTAGFCKIIADKTTDKVLGVHIIGAHATDLISEAVTAMELDATAEDIGKAIHAHPTLGEIVMESAHALHEKCIHLPMQKK